jgi:glutaredoxin 3
MVKIEKMIDMKKIIAENHLVIFGFPECPWCQKAKALLKPWKPRFVHVDSEDRSQLLAATGKTSVPQIYLKGKLLGGYDDTSKKMALVKKTLRSFSKNSRNRNNNTRKVSNRNLFW